MLETEELARPPETGLHLVEHQQRLVPSAEFLRLLPVLGRRHVHALALNGFDNERRDVSPPQLSAQGLDVAEGDRAASGQQLAEALAEVGAAVQGERPGAQPVKGMFGEEDSRAPRGLPGELDGRFDRLGS